MVRIKMFSVPEEGSVSVSFSWLKNGPGFV